MKTVLEFCCNFILSTMIMTQILVEEAFHAIKEKMK